MYSTKIGVEFNAPMEAGDVIKIFWNNGAIYKFAQETFKPARFTVKECKIGLTSLEQAQFYEHFIKIDYPTEFIVTRVGTIVYLEPVGTNLDMTAETSNSGYVSFIYDTPIPLPAPKEIRSRTPKLLITEGTPTDFNASKYVIKQFQGSLSTIPTQPISYIKTKQKITPSQSDVYINLSNLVKEDLKGAIGSYGNADFLNTTETKYNESKWVYVRTERELNGVPLVETPKVELYYVVDGYCSNNEQHQLPKVLLSSKRRSLYKYAVARVHFKTNDLVTIKMTYSGPNGVTPLVYNITFVPYNRNNELWIQSLRIPVYQLTDGRNKITYEFMYNSEAIRIVYDAYDECKYDAYSLVYKNKYGFLETISMTKKSSKTITTTGEGFLKSVVDIEGVADYTSHSNKRFNVTGTEVWTLNSDYQPEYMNEAFKQAMLSEEVYILDYDGLIIPVIIEDQSLDFKTVLNDKLIQYTIKVRKSQNETTNFL